MSNFNKAYNLRIISIVVTISLVLTTSLYSCPVPRFNLRVPILHQASRDKQDKALKEYRLRMMSYIYLASTEINEAVKYIDGILSKSLDIPEEDGKKYKQIIENIRIGLKDLHEAINAQEFLRIDSIMAYLMDNIGRLEKTSMPHEENKQDIKNLERKIVTISDISNEYIFTDAKKAEMQYEYIRAKIQEAMESSKPLSTGETVLLVGTGLIFLVGGALLPFFAPTPLAYSQDINTGLSPLEIPNLSFNVADAPPSMLLGPAHTTDTSKQELLMQESVVDKVAVADIEAEDTERNEDRWEYLIRKVGEREELFKRGELTILNFRPLYEKEMNKISDDMLAESDSMHRDLYARTFAKLRAKMFMDHWAILSIKDCDKIADVIFKYITFGSPYLRSGNAAQMRGKATILMNEFAFCRPPSSSIVEDDLTSFDHELVHLIENYINYINKGLPQSSATKYLLRAQALSMCVTFEDEINRTGKSLSYIIDGIDDYRRANRIFDLFPNDWWLYNVLKGIELSGPLEDTSTWDLYPATIYGVDFKKGKSSFEEVFRDLADYTRGSERRGETYRRASILVGQSYRMRYELMKSGASFEAALYAQLFFLNHVTLEAKVDGLNPARAAIGMKVFSLIYDTSFYRDIWDILMRNLAEKGLNSDENIHDAKNVLRRIFAGIISSVVRDREVDEKIKFGPKEREITVYSVAENIKNGLISVLGKEIIVNLVIDMIEPGLESEIRQPIDSASIGREAAGDSAAVADTQKTPFLHNNYSSKIKIGDKMVDIWEIAKIPDYISRKKMTKKALKIMGDFERNKSKYIANWKNLTLLRRLEILSHVEYIKKTIDDGAEIFVLNKNITGGKVDEITGSYQIQKFIIGVIAINRRQSDIEIFSDLYHELTHVKQNRLSLKERVKEESIFIRELATHYSTRGFRAIKERPYYWGLFDKQERYIKSALSIIFYYMFSLDPSLDIDKDIRVLEKIVSNRDLTIEEEILKGYLEQVNFPLDKLNQIKDALIEFKPMFNFSKVIFDENLGDDAKLKAVREIGRFVTRRIDEKKLDEIFEASVLIIVNMLQVDGLNSLHGEMINLLKGIPIEELEKIYKSPDRQFRNKEVNKFLEEFIPKNRMLNYDSFRLHTSPESFSVFGNLITFGLCDVSGTMPNLANSNKLELEGDVVVDVEYNPELSSAGRYVFDYKGKESFNYRGINIGQRTIFICRPKTQEGYHFEVEIDVNIKDLTSIQLQYEVFIENSGSFLRKGRSIFKQDKKIKTVTLPVEYISHGVQTKYLDGDEYKYLGKDPQKQTIFFKINLREGEFIIYENMGRAHVYDGRVGEKYFEDTIIDGGDLLCIQYNEEYRDGEVMGDWDAYLMRRVSRDDPTGKKTYLPRLLDVYLIGKTSFPLFSTKGRLDIYSAILGSSYLNQGNHEKAEESYNRVLTMDPDNLYAHLGLGELFLRKINAEKIEESVNVKTINTYCDKAIKHLEKALEIGISDTNMAQEVLCNLGDAYFERGLYKKAIEAYTGAIELNPDNIDAYEGRAKAYEKSGDTEKAQADRNKIQEFKPPVKEEQQQELKKKRQSESSIKGREKESLSIPAMLSFDGHFASTSQYGVRAMLEWNQLILNPDSLDAVAIKVHMKKSASDYIFVAQEAFIYRGVTYEAGTRLRAEWRGTEYVVNEIIPKNLPSIEEQEQILDNSHYDWASFETLGSRLKDLINDYGSEKVFYTLKTAIDKRIISEGRIASICSDLDDIRKGDKEIDSFLAFAASKGYIEAYYALGRRLKEDFIKVPNLIITKEAISRLLKEMPRIEASYVLKVIFSEPDNLDFINAKILRKFLLKMSIKSIDAKTFFNLMRGKEIDENKKKQLKEVAFLLASYHFDVSKRPYRIPELLKDGVIGKYKGAANVEDWDTPTPNILEIYIYPEKNILPPSEYRPMSITDQPPLYYSIKNWSEVVSLSDTTAWPSDFLKKLLKMKKEEILYFNKTKYFVDESPQFRTGISLLNFLQSFGKDDKGIYMSIYDIWDFKVGEGFFKNLFLFEARLMELIGTGIPIYDRYYFSEEEIEKELERRGETVQIHDSTIKDTLSGKTRNNL